MELGFDFPESFSKLGEDKTINKLIILFVFDKMEVALSQSTILDICCSSNLWIPYMDCKPLIPELVDCGFIYEIKNSHTEPLYTITQEGRVCLANFFIRIPSSMRESISEFVKNTRMKYKRKQEYDSNYYKNDDGTYTVILKIVDPFRPVMRLEFTVPNKTAAKNIYKNWENRASNVYSAIYEQLME